MRFKLDENLPHDLTAALTARGHDVDTVLDENRSGQKDPVVITAAGADERMLITLDRGIGDIRQYPPGSHAGVLVLRAASQDPDSIIELVQRLLRSHDPADLAGYTATSNRVECASVAPNTTRP